MKKILLGLLVFLLFLLPGCVQQAQPTDSLAPSTTLGAEPSEETGAGPSEGPGATITRKEGLELVEVFEKVFIPTPSAMAGNENKSFEELLGERMSVREWTSEDLSLQEISALLWAAYGFTESEHRTVPSAHGVYPLVIYFASAHGLFKYYPEWEAIQKLSENDFRRGIAERIAGQTWAANAPVMLVIVWDKQKMGENEKRFVETEAGCVIQNVYLEAAFLGLGTVVVGGGFDEEGIQALLELPENELPLYAMPVGRLKK